MKSERENIRSMRYFEELDNMKDAKASLKTWKTNRKTIEDHNEKLAAQLEKDAVEHQRLRQSVPTEERAELDHRCAELYQSDKYNRRDRFQSKLKDEFSNDYYWDAEERIDDTLGIDWRMERQAKQDIDLKREIERVRNLPARTRSKSRDMEI